MKKYFIIIVMFIAINLAAVDYLDINFFVDPQFDFENSNLINFQIKNLANDSIPQITILSGDILSGGNADSLVINFLNKVKPNLALPTDYHFEQADIHFPLLATNISSYSLNMITNKIIHSDSISVGFLGIYSPDFSVKNDLGAEMNFHTFELIEKYSKVLAEKVDVVILVSALGKYIDADAVKGLPIDYVLSFDYMNTRAQRFYNRTSFFSIRSSNGDFGKLRLIYKDGKVSHDWIKTKLPNIEE